MNDKVKDIIVTVSFVLIIAIAFWLNLFTKDKEVSLTERRKLASFPEFSVEGIKSGENIKEWEKYVLDQFVGRDTFRKIKSIWSLNVFRQKDNNKLFVKDDMIFSMEYPLNDKNIIISANLMNKVYDKYLNGMNVNYAIIPEKNHYLENDDHLKLDFNEIENIMENKLNKNFKYIDIENALEVDDFYKTDLHWKQENLEDVLNVIRQGLNLEKLPFNYNIKKMQDFYGVYYSQLNMEFNPDTLNILTNETTKNSITYNYETRKKAPIYTPVNKGDRYNIFVSGPTSIISLENPNLKTDKELILFRDSFGSSLSPLLLENYRKITLVDLRYINSEYLGKFIKFDNQDVLFLYSSVVLNKAPFK